jgi:hypothetical protein
VTGPVAGGQLVETGSKLDKSAGPSVGAIESDAGLPGTGAGLDASDLAERLRELPS